MALIGNLLFRLFTSESAAVSFGKKNGWTKEELNTGRGPEKVTDISFIDFWRVKREILDDNYEDERDIWNLGQPRNKTLEALSAGTGYSIEELAYILHYWEGKCKKQKKKQKRTQEMAPMMDYLLDLKRHPSFDFV